MYPITYTECKDVPDQTEENVVMKDALARMKNSKEKSMCWQDGRLFEDKEDWVVDSCTKCTCQVGPHHNHDNTAP